MVERLEREKKSSEKELERVRERVSVDMAKAEETIQQLNNRVHEAERARDEACRKTNSAIIAQRAAETRSVYTYTYNMYIRACIFQYISVSWEIYM